MVQVLVLKDAGINCEHETRYAFELAGARADIVHLNDIIAGERKLEDYDILAIPGGFSYGDDTGSGKALANKIRNNIWDDLMDFVERDTLGIGICNGFQVMTNLGLVPAFNQQYEPQVALVHNDSARYTCRWVDVQFDERKSPWTKNLGVISMPVAHGEGKFNATYSNLIKLDEKGMLAGQYLTGISCKYQNLPANPNGSLEDIASITDETGRFIGMMPHPERAINFTHLPHWPLQKEIHKRKGESIPEHTRALKLFRNAVEYFE